MLLVILLLGSAFGRDVWTPVGPRALVELSDAAIHPVDDQVWAVISNAGGVFVTADAGATWRDVLGPIAARGSGDEQVSAEVEARLGELAADLGPPDPIEDPDLSPDELEELIEAAAEDASDAARDIVDQVQAEVAVGVWLPDPSDEAPSPPRLWFDSGGRLIVARADGLRVSPDLGARWVLALDEAVTAWTELPGGAWLVGTPSGLLASVAGVRWTGLVAFRDTPVTDLFLDGELYACTSDGPWTTSPADLGAWRRMSDGACPASEGIGVEVRGAVRLLVSVDGLFRSAPPPVPSSAEPRDWVPLGALIDASSGRAGLAVPTGRRAASALLPALTVEGQLQEEVGDQWNADTWTIRGVEGFWQIRGALTWTGARSVDEPSDTDLELLVVDDEVLVDDGSATWLLQSRVERGGSSYRQDLAATVRRLYVLRQDLVLDDPPGPLVEQVERALQVAEIDARLDALTDGAVSAWIHNGRGER